ncbi:hypothetical protein FE782_10045 [Paenibacillus antri]|uniref:Uncharacterized protein n=1 Tax=Paenibacillus antri TaxID=2582848 RepID=A0A5R9GD99_9BACL|nr:hypothetical protein [Paenibacillus antri]TLS52306.1 hypothetical protein FE782_10045 [Paenibacillus antri]
MNAKSAAFIGLRLLALYWGVRSLEAWGQLLTLLVPELPWGEINRSSVAIAGMIPGAVQGGIAVVLWLSARRAASAIAGTRKSAEPEGEPFRDDWAAPAFAVAGIVVAVSAVPGLAGSTYTIMQPPVFGFELNEYQTIVYRGALIEGFVQLALGLAMAFGSRGMAAIVERFGFRR